MKIYYDDLAGNIVLGKYGRLFPGGSLEAISRGNKIAIQYIDSEFVELIVRPNQVRTVNNGQAGSDLASVLDYLNAEFAKKPASGGGGQTTFLNIDGGNAETTFSEYLIRLDFGANGATINPTGE